MMVGELTREQSLEGEIANTAIALEKHLIRFEATIKLLTDQAAALSRLATNTKNVALQSSMAGNEAYLSGSGDNG
jgi:hypothetical protein